MNKQMGFTLVELMIAGFIGIFIMTGLMNLFITTNRSVTLSDSISQNQETGRFAMDYLTKYIRIAGYSEDSTTFVPPLYIKSGNGDSEIKCEDIEADACAFDNIEDTKGNITGDRLSVPFSVGGDEGDEVTTCTGTVVGGDGTNPDVTLTGAQDLVNVFWVSTIDDEPLRELRCRTYNRNTGAWLDNPVAIINNVERFEFQIGVSKEATDKYASQYISLETFEGDENLNNNNIRSIRIAILTTSQDQLDERVVKSSVRKRNYNILDSETITMEDSNLRNIFVNTIELPNMIESAAN